MKLVNGIICSRDKLIKGRDLFIRQGKISLKKQGEGVSESVIDLKGSYILPGFIELHTHGAGLFEFTAGKYDPKTKSFRSSPEIYQDELPRYVRLRTSTGVTSLYPGTWAAPIKQLRFCFGQLKRYMESNCNGQDGCVIRGGLLEGSFFNPEMCGAQNPAYALRPEIKTFEEINKSGVIKLVNIVPDYGEKSCRVIKHLTKKGIAVGAGHTKATAEQFKAAIDSGLRYVIHFLNGPTGGSYKPFNKGGAVEGILRDDRIYVELIADGFHVNPAYLRDVIERKGPRKVIIITDAMFISQSKEVTDFKSGGIAGRLSDDGKYVYVVGKKPITLFGSLLTMDVAFGNILSWLTREMQGIWYHCHKAMNFEQALLATARMCVTNVCDMLKMSKAEDLGTGAIEDGKWADLLVADIKGKPGNYRLSVRKVFVRGRVMRREK